MNCLNYSAMVSWWHPAYSWSCSLNLSHAARRIASAKATIPRLLLFSTALSSAFWVAEKPHLPAKSESACRSLWQLQNLYVGSRLDTLFCWPNFETDGSGWRKITEWRRREYGKGSLVKSILEQLGIVTFIGICHIILALAPHKKQDDKCQHYLVKESKQSSKKLAIRPGTYLPVWLVCLLEFRCKIGLFILWWGTGVKAGKISPI